VVLEALNNEPFEPALSSSLRDFTIKTAFLIAVASGRRSSELHALSIEDYLIWHSKGGITLHFRPSFLAKNERSNFVASPLSLPCLDRTAGSRRLSCPVRAIKWYLKKTEMSRGGIKQLFITSNKPVKPAAKTTIAGWVAEAITRSKASHDNAKPRAHSARSKAVTAAFHRGLTIQDVMNTVSWKSSHVFISTYLHDQAPQSASRNFARAVLTGRR
jgi:integrase